MTTCTLRCDPLRRLGSVVLGVMFLVALALPRFGVLWHDHPEGETAHTHDAHTVAYEIHTVYTHQSARHRHPHSHAYTHHQGHDHDDADHVVVDRVEVRLAAATRSGHAHYIDDSLLLEYCPLPLLILVVLTIFLCPCRREPQPCRHLSAPTARAPPV